MLESKLNAEQLELMDYGSRSSGNGMAKGNSIRHNVRSSAKKGPWNHVSDGYRLIRASVKFMGSMNREYRFDLWSNSRNPMGMKQNRSAWIFYWI